MDPPLEMPEFDRMEEGMPDVEVFPPLGHCQIEGISIEVCQDHPRNTNPDANPYERREIPAGNTSTGGRDTDSFR
ncbi:hypothetical protein TNCT_496051 [Trichonephila clavata]|uniref:Uncharacterized protein n=1 Tax=Trichonephila clavata TaxID=2740835 RepID=A0A8X6L4V5_TRICU|nr:hypothetical protein TNCT_496051 [Trichonephila clavata]